ncbi:trehalose-phosphatase [Paracoccus sp. MBLB3053]|uniref:Trehalose 6-phosphate phosphatase n=1 Tax=Paracoccus aurantius TaxID=3073814 RepID=A0ABU2HX14_9RHOB|nr:trehalose-phosphatase [Paracoccus sp. MBLB3053]MDS9469100.1 trehalose-phosphatase [Paracoccus sp. MBLB3053]
MKDNPKEFEALDLDAHAFFFDFDGTLADIALHPRDVFLTTELRRSILSLSLRTGGAVAIITGRNRAEIHPHLGEELPVAGLHGVDFPADAEGSAANSDAERRILAVRPLLPALAELVKAHPGALLEDKGQGLALHWRGAPMAEAAMMVAAERTLEQLGQEWSLQPGKCVAEIRPVGGDKGTALLRFMTQPPFEGRRPIAFGDDLNDLPMFEAARSLGGLAVALGERDLPADIRLSGPAELAEWLERRLDA